MVERDTRATVATMFAPGAFALGAVVVTGPAAAQHLRVRRLAPGARIRLVNGAGGVAVGTLTRLGRFEAAVALDAVRTLAPPPAVHLIVPVADRDRMLWLAEKSAELGVASWRPAVWRRSRSVSPRGEGSRFRDKVEARMAAALEQSGGAWLPELIADAAGAEALAAAPAGQRLVLDPTGVPLLVRPVAAPVTVVVGPEGGFEDDERRVLAEQGYRAVSLGTSILRFETAGVAAVAAIRAALAAGAERSEAEEIR